MVDLNTGKLTTDRYRIPTPPSRLPEDVLPAVQQIVDYFEYAGPIGVGFPAVVIDGVVKTPFTALGIREWIGIDVAQRLSYLTQQHVTVINDADAAGLAEIHFGAGIGRKGVVVVLTLGTGVGSGLFLNGQLVPNTEFGKLYLRNRNRFVEHRAADRAREQHDLTWAAWAANLDEMLHYVDLIFSPQLFILGGGVSKKFDKFSSFLTLDTPIVPAKLRNEAGIVGAAMAGQLAEIGDRG
jgi:polyphosphate glucokinase